MNWGRSIYSYMGLAAASGFAAYLFSSLTIVTFMAILDMVKMQRLIIRQADAFTEIRIYPTELLDRDPVTDESIITTEALPQAG